MRRPVVTGVSQIALMALAPQHNDSAPDLHIRVLVIIPRRSEWWRSATQTAGPCVSLPLNRQLQTSCLVGLGRSPVRPNLLGFLGAVGVLTCWFARNTRRNVVTK